MTNHVNYHLTKGKKATIYTKGTEPAEKLMVHLAVATSTTIGKLTENSIETSSATTVATIAVYKIIA